MSLKGVIVLMLLLSFAESQNIPASYTYTTTDIISVNGSSATGHCSNVTTNSDGTTTCTAPSSSVLFDRDIPTLTGLDGDMWASQLLTLQLTTGMSTVITFDFSNNPNFRLESLEVVVFNCPQRGTKVQTIRLFDNIEFGTITPTITSCDSLVRVCTPGSSFATSLSLQFSTSIAGSEWVYLAELKFFGNSRNCPQGIVTIIIIPTPPDTTLATLTNPSSTNKMFTTAKSVTKTNTGVTQNITTISASSTPPSFTIVLVVVLTFLLLILVGIVVAVLILWRYYCAKHHKHNNTDQHTALEQFQHTSSSQAQTHTHPALSLCEETGQVHYASPCHHHAQGEDSPSHQTYSHLQQQICKVKGGVRVHEEGSVGQKEEMGEYSTLLHEHNRPRELGRAELGANGTESLPRAQQYYTQVDKKMKKEKIEADKTDSLPSAEESVQPPEIHTCAPMDQFYSAQVDMKKKEKKQKHVATTQTYSSECDTGVDLLYAQVDKKKKKRQKDEETTQLHTETNIPVDQLYAQVDKKKKSKEKDISHEELGAVYSVVNKPSAPQLPPKSQLLIEELQ